MSRLFEKLGRIGTIRFYWYGSGVLLALFIVFAVIHRYTSWKWLLWAGVVTIMIWPIMSFIYIATVWSWHIEDLMNEYKKNDNILSGGLAILALFAMPFIISLVFSQMEGYAAMKEFFKGLSSLIIAAMPAFIGLLGVQYSVAIQERNRKEDIRLGAKPFFSVQCSKIETIADEDGHHAHKMNIIIVLKNISQNIGIPQKVVSLDDENCEINFKYAPIPPTEEYCESVIVSSIESYGTTARIAIYYADVYNNTYKMQVEFLLHKNEALSEARIISDDVVKE